MRSGEKDCQLWGTSHGSGPGALATVPCFSTHHSRTSLRYKAIDFHSWNYLLIVLPLSSCFPLR